MPLTMSSYYSRKKRKNKILEYTYEFTSLQKISMKYIQQMKLKNQEIV
jgi:hypothetical protein